MNDASSNSDVFPDQDTEGPAREFFQFIRSRRSTRVFSDRSVGMETIEWIVSAAGTAPSGANKQPWRYVAVSNRDVKERIRKASETEEKLFYESESTARWREDLLPLGTNASKRFLVTAPWVLVVFKLKRTDDDKPVYYPNESVGISTGLLLAAVHACGLASLTYTPPRMGFLNEILERPSHEKPFLIIPIGHPDTNYSPPDIDRKPLEDILVVID